MKNDLNKHIVATEPAGPDDSTEGVTSGALKQAGISLFDFVLYIAIALVLISIIFSVYASATSSSNVMTASTNFTIMTGQVRGYYQGSSEGYKTLDSEIVVAAGIAPNSIVQPGGGGASNSLRNTWGGSILLAPTNDATGNQNRNFTVTYNEVARKDCASFVNKVSEGALSIDIDGTSVKDVSQGESLNRAQLAKSCDTDSGGVTDIVFEIH